MSETVSDAAVRLRVMRSADIDDGVRLCREAGWNQRRADWELFLALRPEGCFVAEAEGETVGTATTVDYDGAAGWIAMVLVDGRMRRRGIGRRLLLRCLEALEGCRSVLLDATPMGKKVYDTLGFGDLYPLRRMLRPAAPPPPRAEAPRVRPMTEADLPAAVALDTEAFGLARPRVIAGFRALGPDLARVAEDGAGRLCGLCLVRPGEKHAWLGPLAARDAASARALVLSVLAATDGASTGLDIRADATAWGAWLESLGFAEERPFIRMARGASYAGGCAGITYAISGPELG